MTCEGVLFTQAMRSFQQRLAERLSEFAHATGLRAESNRNFWSKLDIFQRLCRRRGREADHGRRTPGSAFASDLAR